MKEIIVVYRQNTDGAIEIKEIRCAITNLRDIVDTALFENDDIIKVLTTCIGKLNENKA